MKKIFLTIALLAGLIFANSAYAQSITTGNSGASTTVINCVNNTNGNHCNTNNPPPPPGNPPPTNGGGSGGSGGGAGGSGGGFTCTAGTPGDTHLVSVVKNGQNSVVLTWTKADNATDYVITYGLGSNNNSFGVPSTGDVTSFTVGALDLSKTYCFNVIPVHECRQGNPSNPVCTALGGVMGLSNTASDSNIPYQAFLAASFLLISTGLFMIYKNA